MTFQSDKTNNKNGYFNNAYWFYNNEKLSKFSAPRLKINFSRKNKSTKRKSWKKKSVKD